MSEWHVIARRNGLVALAAEGASLLLETPRGGVFAADLRDAIARLAPHVTFGEICHRGNFVERSATVIGERMTIGRYARGASTIAYLLTARVPVVIDDVVAAYFGDGRSPFDYLAD